MLIVTEESDTSTADLLESLRARENITMSIVPEMKKLTLGQLRNWAVEQATSEYVAQWDDDDFYHPERLSAQMRAIAEHRVTACVLRRVLLLINGRKMISSVRDWEGTLVCRRTDLVAYPSLSRGEDTPVIEALAKGRRLVRLDRPELYAYIYHGMNTWDANHWNDFVECGSEVDRPEQQLLLDMLASDMSRRAAADREMPS
jgi:glycosyltransferase involved in cell wall biosynthesis